MNLAGASITILMAVIALFAPRRWAVLAVMATVCYVTRGQQIFLLGLNFMAFRIVLLVALVRIIARGEWKQWQMNEIDWALLLYAAAMTFVPLIRTGSMEVLIYRLGCVYDILLSYFVFRSLLRDADETLQFLKSLALLILPLAVLMVIESQTGWDPFRAMGGIGYAVDIVRNGHLRCEGSFCGPITAGIFGATLVPLFVGLYRADAGRKSAIVGMFCGIAITVASHSSGPLVALLTGVMGWCVRRFRLRMRSVRWGILFFLVLLQLCMKVPVWFLFTRLSEYTGGDGYHRALLFDSAVRHFGDWWLLGTDNTGDWAITMMSDGSADLTNEYVAAGVTGGLLAVIAFVLILVRCFRRLGDSMNEAREQSSNAELLYWGLGAALYAHIVTVFSITYFDQLLVPWWGVLAIISSVTSVKPQTETANEPEQSVVEPWLKGQAT